METIGAGIVEKRESDSPEIWLETYLSLGQASEELVSQIKNEPICFNLPLIVDTVINENWEEIWQRHHPPTSIDDKVSIYRPWDDFQPTNNTISLIIEPSMAFGTGRHETTQHCIQGLLDHVKPGMSVLDLGCGTGILAFVAARLGASYVLAIDNDPDAIQLAINNRGVNQLDDKVHIVYGSITSLYSTARKFDIIVANIVKHVLIQLLEERMIFYLRPNGKLLLSGILDSEQSDFTKLLTSYGLKSVKTKSRGEWSYIEATTFNG